jgi:hypothetical protein
MRSSSFLMIVMMLPAAVWAQGHLKGVWQKAGGGRGGANATSQWSSGELPLTPAGLEQLNFNKPGKGPRAVMPAFGNDPLGGANPPGLYRTLIYNRPFEFIQTGTPRHRRGQSTPGD